MVDIPERTDDAADVIIYGVESEQIEEENDAYNDMRYELGINKDIENKEIISKSLRNSYRQRR